MNDISNKIILDGYKSLSDKVDELKFRHDYLDSRLDCQRSKIRKMIMKINDLQDQIDDNANHIEEESDEDQSPINQIHSLFEKIITLINDHDLDFDELESKLSGAIMTIFYIYWMDPEEVTASLQTINRAYEKFLEKREEDE